MRLRSLMVLILVLFAMVPVIVAGIFTYTQSKDIVYDTIYDASKKDLEERLDFYLELCEFYGEKVQQGELTREDAIGEIATLVNGPMRDDGTRDLTKGLGKGEEGYMSAWYYDLTYAIHPFREGTKAIDPVLVKTDMRLNKSRVEGRISFTYEWWNPGEPEPYLKLTVGDYSKSLDLVVSTNVVLDEFLLPISIIRNILRNISIKVIVVAIGLGLIASLIISGEIAKPFAKLSEASDKIIKGDLSARVDIKSPIKEFSSVGKDINLMVDNLQEKIESIRRSEAELEESRTYFQNFFNVSPVPLTLIGLDGKRIDCNPAMGRLTGRKREELVNVPVEATYLKEEQPLVRKKLVDETIEKGYMYGFETYFLKPDGTKLPIVVNTALLRDKDGKPQAIIYSASDISELKEREKELSNAVGTFGEVLSKVVKRELSARVNIDKLTGKYKTIGADINKTVGSLQNNINELKQTKEEIEENRAFLQQILINMPDILVVTDNEGRWLQVSPSFEGLTGFKIEEVLGKKTTEQPVYKDLPEAIELNKQMWQRVYKGEVVIGLEIPWRTKQRKKIILSASEGTLKDSKGNNIGRVFVARDITELKRKEQELKETTIDKKYFEAYSKRAIELADSWGMGEVFKHEMEEWVKKQATNHSRRLKKK